jgi:hypothetical protein
VLVIAADAGRENCLALPAGIARIAPGWTRRCDPLRASAPTLTRSFARQRIGLRVGCG